MADGAPASGGAGGERNADGTPKPRRRRGSRGGRNRKRPAGTGGQGGQAGQGGQSGARASAGDDQHDAAADRGLTSDDVAAKAAAEGTAPKDIKAAIRNWRPDHDRL